MRRTTIAMFSILLACDDPPRGDDDAAATAETELGTTTDAGTSESTGGSTDESSGAETTDDVRLDVPVPQEVGCQKVDFLFVIDNSGSMSDEQDRLIAGFPGFISDIEEAIEQYDYHMMVVTTNSQDVPEATACDDALGAGRVVAADGTDCGLLDPDAPQRFAEAEDEDEDLASVFACVAEVGLEGGGTEQPIWSMAQAITAQNSPGGCNEGFLRDDAILVVTIITDEEDDGDSPGDPPLWKEVILSAKHGDPKAIVMLGLLGDTDLEDGVCEPFDGSGAGAEGAPRLRKFVEGFPHSSWDSVCQPDYAPFFNAAVADIGEACVEFVPPG